MEPKAEPRPYTPEETLSISQIQRAQANATKAVETALRVQRRWELRLEASAAAEEAARVEIDRAALRRAPKGDAPKAVFLPILPSDEAEEKARRAIDDHADALRVERLKEESRAQTALNRDKEDLAAARRGPLPASPVLSPRGSSGVPEAVSASSPGNPVAEAVSASSPSNPGGASSASSAAAPKTYAQSLTQPIDAARRLGPTLRIDPSTQLPPPGADLERDAQLRLLPALGGEGPTREEFHLAWDFHNVLDVGANVGGRTTIPESFAHYFRSLQRLHPYVKHHLLSFCTAESTKESVKQSIRDFDAKVGGASTCLSTVNFADQRVGPACTWRGRRYGPGKDVLLRTLGYHALVDDNAEICQAALKAGFLVYPIRTHREKHRWAQRSYADLPEAAEAISAWLTEDYNKRADRLAAVRRQVQSDLIQLHTPEGLLC